MSDNRVIIKLKRVPSLSDPSVDKIQNGENFINEMDNGFYFKDLNGNIVGLTSLKPVSASDAVVKEDGSLELELSGGAGLTLTPFQFIIRYISPIANINDKLSFKGIDGEFNITDIYGKVIQKGEIKKDMLVQLLYVGDNTFRLMSGGGISTDAEGNIVLDGNTIVNGDLTITGGVSGIKEEDISEIVRKIVGDGIAVGTIVSFIKGPLPKGFLRLNGNKFSKEMYPDLFDYLGTDTVPDTSDLSFKGAGNTIQPGEVKGAFINMPVFVKGNANKAGGYLAPVLVEATGDDMYAADGMRITADGSVRDGFDVSPRSIGVIWAIKAGSSYINAADIDLNAIADKLDDTYRISEIDRKFIMVSAIQSQLGSKSSTDVPSMLLIDDLDIPGLRDAVTNQLTSIKQLTKDKADALIGEIRLLPFRPSELPKGWYSATGDRYNTDTVVGKALIKLPTNLKEDLKIVEQAGSINTPNMFHSDGRGMFIRAGKIVGVTQEDAIRDITGSFLQPIFKSSTTGEPIVPNKARTGAFTARNDEYFGRAKFVAYELVNSSEYYPGLEFAASKVVPTSTENRPINIAFYPAIYLGV